MLEFIVLGQVPGTNYQVTFSWWLIIVLLIIAAFKLPRTLQRKIHTGKSTSSPEQVTI